ncbi:MAG: hypothetical protein U5S82_24095 [Gammaproteobacteria bacterium]|nr:hypothetical protein [Gammaproteobacteria bacterium]
MPRVLLLVLLMSFLPGPALGQEPWSATLQSGRSIHVDPRTNRVTVQSAGGKRQLWDGVHRLEDGSSITVRSGVMVPNMAFQEFKRERRHPPQAFISEGPMACRQLIRKTCGLHGECADSPACGPARQLLEIYEEERRGISHERAFGEGYLPADVQCRQALEDRSFFVPCEREQRGNRPTACQRLADKVCGSEGQCAQREACGPARQLLETETRERRGALNPDAPTPATGQCRQALGDDGFFTPCEW